MMTVVGVLACGLSGAIVGGILFAIIKVCRQLTWAQMASDVVVGLVAWVFTSALYVYAIDRRHFEEAKSVVARVEQAQTKIRQDTERLTSLAQRFQDKMDAQVDSFQHSLDTQLGDFREAVKTTNELLHVVQIAGVNTLRSQVKQGEKVNHP